MSTNLAIDDRILQRALEVGKLHTKKATVTQALIEFIQRRQQQNVKNLFGKIEFDEGYDYKALRKRR